MFNKFLYILNTTNKRAIQALIKRVQEVCTIEDVVVYIREGEAGDTLFWYFDIIFVVVVYPAVNFANCVVMSGAWMVNTDAAVEWIGAGMWCKCGAVGIADIGMIHAILETGVNV